MSRGQDVQHRNPAVKVCVTVQSYYIYRLKFKSLSFRLAATLTEYWCLRFEYVGGSGQKWSPSYTLPWASRSSLGGLLTLYSSLLGCDRCQLHSTWYHRKSRFVNFLGQSWFMVVQLGLSMMSKSVTCATGCVIQIWACTRVRKQNGYDSLCSYLWFPWRTSATRVALYDYDDGRRRILLQISG